MENKYFKVTCKCGHVGKEFFIAIDFPIVAQNRKDASAIARYIPRVKHHHKDAIIDCKEITKEEFYTIKNQNKSNPYLRCSNVQEQNMIENLSFRLEKENNKLFKTKARNTYFKRKKQKEINDYLNYELLKFKESGLEYGVFVY